MLDHPQIVRAVHIYLHRIANALSSARYAYRTGTTTNRQASGPGAELQDEAIAIATELGMKPLLERVLAQREILKVQGEACSQD